MGSSEVVAAVQTTTKIAMMGEEKWYPTMLHGEAIWRELSSKAMASDSTGQRGTSGRFESVFYLKPFSDKGVYGWLYRVYPEPWQVVYESVRPGKDGNAEVTYVPVAVLEKRPTEVVDMLVKASQKR